MRPIYIILLIGLFLFLLSFERIQKERTGHKVAEVMEDISFKEAKNQYLRYQIGLYKSAPRITEIALERGLKVIPPQNIIILEVPREP